MFSPHKQTFHGNVTNDKIIEILISVQCSSSAVDWAPCQTTAEDRQERHSRQMGEVSCKGTCFSFKSYAMNM